jgi:membrane protein implicated in regulation of membrane protease activity
VIALWWVTGGFILGLVATHPDPVNATTVAWILLALSMLVAPVVARVVHDPQGCRVCEQRQQQSRGRHPSGRFQ